MLINLLNCIPHTHIALHKEKNFWHLVVKLFTEAFELLIMND